MMMFKRYIYEMRFHVLVSECMKETKWLNDARRTLPLITRLYKIFFYNAGFIGSNNRPFIIQEMQLHGKARLLILWTSQEKLLDTWTSR